MTSTICEMSRLSVVGHCGFGRLRENIQHWLRAGFRVIAVSGDEGFDKSAHAAIHIAEHVARCHRVTLACEQHGRRIHLRCLDKTSDDVHSLSFRYDVVGMTDGRRATPCSAPVQIF